MVGLHVVHDEVVDRTVADDCFDLAKMLLSGGYLDTIDEYDLLTHEQIRVVADAMG